MGISFSDIFPFLFIFARLGPAFSFMPGIQAAFIPPQIRLLAAFALTVMITFSLLAKIPPAPSGAGALILVLSQEVLVGVMIGALLQLIFMALDVTGSLLAAQMGLTSASLFNPALQSYTPLLTTFLMAGAMVFLFVTDIYQYFFARIIDSYEFISLKEGLPVEAFAHTFMSFLTVSFDLAVQLAMPLMLVSSLFLVGLGVVGRFIPGVQIFFVALPGQILLGLLVLGFGLTTLLEQYGAYLMHALTALDGI